MKEYIQEFGKEFDYPAEAVETLVNAYAALENMPAAYHRFQKYLDLYNQDSLTDYEAVFPSLDEAAELTGIHKYTLHLLFFLCLSRHTRELYKKNRIPYPVFYDSISDLKWKLFECHKVHGIWGSFVAFWFPGFFNLTRFALGRLQFETVEFESTYQNGCHTINPGDIVLNMHIPSCGPLIQKDCIESYQKAARFYKKHFQNRPAAFVCHSWLLFPKHREFLPPNSNILKFMDNFDIISSYTIEDGSDLWRIFGKEYSGKPEDLPRTTSLQRAYSDWLCQGNSAGGGYGIFLYSDGFISPCH